MQCQPRNPSVPSESNALLPAFFSNPGQTPSFQGGLLSGPTKAGCQVWKGKGLITSFLGALPRVSWEPLVHVLPTLSPSSWPRTAPTPGVGAGRERPQSFLPLGAPVYQIWQSPGAQLTLVPPYSVPKVTTQGPLPSGALSELQGDAGLGGGGEWGVPTGHRHCVSRSPGAQPKAIPSECGQEANKPLVSARPTRLRNTLQSLGT